MYSKIFFKIIAVFLNSKILRRLSSNPKTMGVTVVIRDEELRLPIVSVNDVRNLISKLLQTFSRRLNVRGCPVKSDAFIVIWLDRCPLSFIEPEKGVFIVNHAANQSAFMPHFPVHR